LSTISCPNSYYLHRNTFHDATIYFSLSYGEGSLRDLTHAYTLFAASYKRQNPEQWGQFNLGETMVLGGGAGAGGPAGVTSSLSSVPAVVLAAPEGEAEPDRRK
jgi:hypothetical protein